MTINKEKTPVYIRDGVEVALAGKAEGSAVVFTDGVIRLRREVAVIAPGFYRVNDSYTNISDAQGEFIFILEVECGYAHDFTLIPCVSYDGNKFGTRGEPKGLTRDGKPWVFGYSRTGLPAATITEGAVDGARSCVGMFASTRDAASLVSACSIVVGDDGMTRQRVYRPEIELPVTYDHRDGYGAPRINTISLAAGESFEAETFVSVSSPEVMRFGAADVYANAATVLDLSSARTYTNDELWDIGIDYAKNYHAARRGDYAFFCTGNMPPREKDANGERHVPSARNGAYELGWCGQNSTYILAMITDYARRGDADSLDLGVKALDSWLRLGTLPNGWLASHISNDLTPDPDPSKRRSDSVNTGYGAMQLLAAYETLRRAGVDRPDVRDAMLRFCDMATSLYSDADGMPSSIRGDGSAASYVGSGGVFLCYALTAAYRATGDARYLDAAGRTLRYYDARDLSRFACAAGALDTSCVDKESCCPLLRCALDLYELTGDADYMAIARRAATYLLTWMFTFDALYPDDCDFTRMGFRTKGGTVVSTQHAHIDPWGGLIAYDFGRYAKLSGDNSYREWARLLWDSAMLCMGDGRFVRNGLVYPRGIQGEAYAHTAWYFDDSMKTFTGGFINEWFVGWPNAHRLAVLCLEPDFLK